MRVLICGDRHYTARRTIRKYVRELQHLFGKELSIIQGGAAGADQIAATEAARYQIPCETFLAQWDVYGKAAGPIRNRKMLDSKPDVVIAFHDNIQESRGTKDCINEADKREIPVVLFTKGKKVVYHNDTTSS